LNKQKQKPYLQIPLFYNNNLKTFMKLF